ncbi:MAG: ATP-binding cassette domain-containing protein [Clostridia bacterium]|nr:ATP-binding cassette domain-containing protein [Clostridia bacterium]
MQYVIETDNLVKRYGSVLAVDNVSVHVKKGDVYGLIGKNGAGKTSLLKLILGLTMPTSGEVGLFGGENLFDARKKIGSLIEDPALYKGKTAYENMKRFAILFGAADEEIYELLDLVGLGDVGNKKVKAFSLGMKQRLGIAIALLGKPEIMILDEPTNGLDPAGIKEVRDLILKLNGAGVTFMISSHILDELGKIATVYGIVSEGKLEEVTADFVKKSCRRSLIISVDDCEAAEKALKETFGDISLETGEKSVKILSEVEDNSKITEALFGAGVKIYEMKEEILDFEDFFIERLK